MLGTHVVWRALDGSDVPTPVTDGEYFDIVNDQSIVYVHDTQNGRLVYGRQRLQPGPDSASPVLANGRIYVTNEDGLTTIFATDPEFAELSRNPLDDYCR